MGTLTFLAFTHQPRNVFWFIVEKDREKTAHHCDGLGSYIPNEKTPGTNYRQIQFEDLKDFPEVQAYIQSKLK